MESYSISIYFVGHIIGARNAGYNCIINRLGYLILSDPNNILESIYRGYTKVNKWLNIFFKKE